MGLMAPAELTAMVRMNASTDKKRSSHYNVPTKADVAIRPGRWAEKILGELRDIARNDLGDRFVW